MRPLLDVAEFNEGYRYAEFNSKTDRMAEYGLGALIAGGVAAKLGLFAKLFALLLAVKKFIIIGAHRARRIPRQDVRQEEGRGGLSETSPTDFHVHIEPGGHDIRVPPGENVLAAALAAGIPLPYSCRAGRCASCKAKLLAGSIEYPAGLPPGITPAEAERGEVLLCQARPRSDLSIESRRVPVRASNAAMLRDRGDRAAAAAAPCVLRLRFVEGTSRRVRASSSTCAIMPETRSASRSSARARAMLELECRRTTAACCVGGWTRARFMARVLRVAGPFDRPR